MCLFFVIVFIIYWTHSCSCKMCQIFYRKDTFVSRSSWCSGNSISLFSHKHPVDAFVKICWLPSTICTLAYDDESGEHTENIIVNTSNQNNDFIFFPLNHFISSQVFDQTPWKWTNISILSSPKTSKEVQRSCKVSTLFILLPPLKSVKPGLKSHTLNKSNFQPRSQIDSSHPPLVHSRENSREITKTSY